MVSVCVCVYVHRRKRGEKGEVVETVEDVIVRRLTAERIEELKRLIKDTQEKHRYQMSTWTISYCRLTVTLSLSL